MTDVMILRPLPLPVEAKPKPAKNSMHENDFEY
jgi:hypothetical protein